VSQVLASLKKYIQMEKFKPAIVEQVSRAAKSLCEWVIAIDIYAQVYKTIEPKRMKLTEAEENLKVPTPPPLTPFPLSGFGRQTV
jgi:dynein heavy chain